MTAHLSHSILAASVYRHNNFPTNQLFAHLHQNNKLFKHI